MEPSEAEAEIKAPDPVMTHYESELMMWLGLRNTKLPSDKKRGAQLALEVQGPRPIRPDITVLEAAREWDWLADKVGPEKTFNKLGNRPCSQDYPGHDEHLPHRVPTTLNKAAGQKDQPEASNVSTSTDETPPKEYFPRSKDVIDALAEIEAEDADPQKLAEESADAVERAFEGFDETPELFDDAVVVPNVDPYTETPGNAALSAHISQDLGLDLVSDGQVTAAFDKIRLPEDEDDEKLFDSRVVNTVEGFPTEVPATQDDLAEFQEAQRRLPVHAPLPREFAAMMSAPVAAPADPPPPGAVEAPVAKATIPVRRRGGPTTTDGMELTPPKAQPAAANSRRSIVTTICYGLGVIGVLAVGGALFVTRKPPTPIVVRPTVCMSPDLRRNLPTEAHSHYFPCHRGGPPMFFCNVNAAPTKEERPQFCRTVWAACAPPIGHNVSASEQESCLADPTRSPINH